MAEPLNHALPRVLYGALFCLAIPILLIAWAAATSDAVPLPCYGSRLGGALLAALGGYLMLAGFSALWHRGGGLPMNAFPPPRYVDAGLYSLIPHPIYVGFTLACLGASIVAQSASGLWLVSPAVALACAALVCGYETPDLRQRFGSIDVRWCRWLPEDSPARPLALDHVRYAIFVLLPWLACYELVIALGVPPDGFEPSLPFERQLPICSWTEFGYASTYLVVPLASAIAPSRTALRSFAVRVCVAMAVAFPVYAAVPVLAPRRPFSPATAAGHLLEWERATYPPVAAFPSFHVIWAVLIAHLFAMRFPRARWVGWTWAAAVAVSCITTGMHTVADVAAALVLSFALLRMETVWSVVRSLVERVANSWREWRFGPVRVINHGAWAGAAAFAAVAIVTAATGPAHTKEVAVTALAALLGAGLWAQWIEGCSRLARPFGFYGGLFAVALTAAAGSFRGWNVWLLIAAWCLASPLMQAIGRLRCLVQGCCHGRPTTPLIGIRYTHPSSRVCRLAHLDGVPVHATPLYSILWNGLVALMMIRLWSLGAPLHMIAGIFAILTGAGRFVEEAYRGEPQTPVFARLRLYQWIAIGTVVLGAAITALGASDPAPAPVVNAPGLIVAAVMGLVAGFALGVDFPESDRRFARLA